MYKLYTPPSITCISFIEIGQVVFENQVLKVVKAYKIYKIYAIYQLNAAISHEICEPDTQQV